MNEYVLLILTQVGENYIFQTDLMCMISVKFPFYYNFIYNFIKANLYKFILFCNPLLFSNSWQCCAHIYGQVSNLILQHIMCICSTFSLLQKVIIIVQSLLLTCHLQESYRILQQKLLVTKASWSLLCREAWASWAYGLSSAGSSSPWPGSRMSQPRWFIKYSLTILWYLDILENFNYVK